jgi:KDO2-lipid IV(A) lauroyltransferase
MKNLFVNIIRGLMVVMSQLPLKFHYFMGAILAWIIKNVLRYRYSVVLTNVARSFPDKAYKLPKQIADDFYSHLGEIVAEFMWFGGRSHETIRDSKIVTFTNPELLVEYYEKSPSVTVLCTHCGNWELLGGVFAYLEAGGIKNTFTPDNMKVVYKKLTSSVSDEIFKRNRIYPIKENGADCLVESSNILRYAISHRNDKKVYVYPADQAPYTKAGKHFIGEFMSQPTNAMQGSMGVACKLSHSVLYVTMKRVEKGKYEMTFIPICEDASQVAPEVLLRKYYDLLEQEIRETPANWLWSHKRWK